MSLTVQSPVSGVVVALSDVPDPVFSGKIVGPGVAITPDPAGGGEVSALAPISGTVSKIHPHAYVITHDDGRSFLVHLGLDTVSLGGNGFTLLAAEGQTVDAGQPIIAWSPAQIEAHAATAQEAALLSVQEDAPTLDITRRTFHEHRAIDYSRTLFRADRYTLWVPVAAPKPAFRPSRPRP